MEANETTHLLVDPSIIAAKSRDLDGPNDIRLDFTNENHYTYPNGVIGSLQFQNKVLLILTATLAIILFVIIIDMSITALQVSVPVPPFKDEDTDKN